MSWYQEGISAPTCRLFFSKCFSVFAVSQRRSTVDKSLHIVSLVAASVLMVCFAVLPDDIVHIQLAWLDADHRSTIPNTGGKTSKSCGKMQLAVILVSRIWMKGWKKSRCARREIRKRLQVSGAPINHPPLLVCEKGGGRQKKRAKKKLKKIQSLVLK